MKKFIICAICAICGFTTANAQGKFGHVNTQEIMQAMPEYTKAESEIKALQSQYEADLKSMQDELQKKSEAFDKEQASLPDNIKQQVCWSDRWLCLHHGEQLTPLHQHLTLYRCDCSGKGKAWFEVI